MKKLFYTLALCLLTTLASFAQKAHKNLSPEQKADKRAAALKTQLSLNDEQVAKAKAVFLEQATKTDEWKKAEAAGTKVNDADKKAFRKQQKEKLNAFLTADQQKTWAESKKNKKKKEDN